MRHFRLSIYKKGDHQAAFFCFWSDAPLQQHGTDMADGPGRVQPFRANADAVHDAVATERADGYIQVGLTLFGHCVAAGREEAVALQQGGRTQELGRVPPKTRAAG